MPVGIFHAVVQQSYRLPALFPYFLVPSFFGIKEEGNEKMRENCNGLGEGKCPEGIKRKKTRQEKEKWQMGKSMSRREKGEKGKIGCDRPTHPKQNEGRRGGVGGLELGPRKAPLSPSLLCQVPMWPILFLISPNPSPPHVSFFPIY
jgi:hypothetical protein